LLNQTVEQLFSAPKKPGSSIEEINLQIFDVHLEYVKDFGKNLLANLDARVRIISVLSNDRSKMFNLEKNMI
jgi:hypothetical protein